MVKMFRVGIAFFLALICAGSFVSVSTVSPAWAVAAWTQLGSDIDGEAANDYSGISVDLSSDGSTVAIGAPSNDGYGSNSGHVRVYDLTSGAPVQVGSDINGESPPDNSGYSVSLSSDGSRVAIGAIYNSGGESYAGHVRVYDLTTGGTWIQVGSDINGEAANDYSGDSVSLSSDGSRIAIGATGNDGGGSYAGHVRVYDLTTGGAWVQVGSDIDGEAAGDQLGKSVSLSSDGSTVAIGAPYNDVTGMDAGYVQVYNLTTGGAWVQVGSDINGEAVFDNSGSSVSLNSDGSRVAIGAPGNDGTADFAGHVRVYDLIDSAWAEVGSDIDGEAALDQLGMSVSLSSDGSRVAIGAPSSSSSADNTGHVRVYDLTSGAWVKVVGDIDGEAAGDYSGGSVSLSSDGSRVAIGAPSNSGVGLDSGHARVYDLTTGGGEITSEPRSLKVKNKSATTRTLRWSIPASLNGCTITDYVIQYRVGGTTEWSTFADGTSTNRKVKVTGLTKRVKYQFQVAARTTGGDSPYSTATKAS